jgi:hypothetical protein
MEDIPEPGFRKHWRQALSSMIFESHAITNKYPEAAFTVQQEHKVISDMDVLARSHRLK